MVNPNEDRPLATLPLYTPLLCLTPKTNLVDLLNIFQTGKKGHLALVCARPMVAEDSLNAEHAVPEAAGFMGYVRGLDENYVLLTICAMMMMMMISMRCFFLIICFSFALVSLLWKIYMLEELLQEEIYDESAKMELEAIRISTWAAKKWKK